MGSERADGFSDDMPANVVVRTLAPFVAPWDRIELGGDVAMLAPGDVIQFPGVPNYDGNGALLGVRSVDGAVVMVRYLCTCASDIPDGTAGAVIGLVDLRHVAP